MADSDFQNVEDPFNADLQKALMAAFGDEAAGETDAQAPDFSDMSDEELAAMKSLAGDMDAVDDPSTALEELLQKVSQAVDDGVTPEMLLGGNELVVQERSDESQTESSNTGPRHVVFEIGDQQFGLPLSGVLEIDRCGDVTTLPRTPAWLRGVTNLRGQILSVTDLRNLLQLKSDRQGIGEKIIVVNSELHDASTAVVVDRVLGIRNLAGDRGPLSGLNDRVAGFSDGISVNEQSTTVLIDPDLLLGCNELQAFAKK